jgi:GNAT superfamily N-acetyltransferase
MRGTPTAPVAIAPVAGALPAGFAGLQAEARAEGHRHLDRLAAEWAAGTTRFDRAGEALLAAWLNGELVGIGGLTIDPHQPGALRMRRFYVRKAYRGAGIGRALAEALMAPARVGGGLITVNAAAGSRSFWEALGFVAETGCNHTHVLAAPPPDRPSAP